MRVSIEDARTVVAVVPVSAIDTARWRGWKRWRTNGKSWTLARTYPTAGEAATVLRGLPEYAVATIEA
jgi:hypothetical protein